MRMLRIGLMGLLLPLATAAPVWACAACYGDPESPLTQGARDGVLAMVIITYMVMISMIAMFTFSVVRARRQYRSGETE